jgi:hypothetical protein
MGTAAAILLLAATITAKPFGPKWLESAQRVYANSCQIDPVDPIKCHKLKMMIDQRILADAKSRSIPKPGAAKSHR